MVFDMTLKQKDITIGLKVDGVVDSSVQGRFIGACTTIPVIPDDEKADYAGMVILYTGSETGYTANTYYKYSGTAWEKYVTADVANKVDKVSGKGLSTEDFTTALKNKLDGIDLSKYATTSALNTGLANKVDKDGDKVLSTNDFTNELKTKLVGIDLSNYATTTALTEGLAGKQPVGDYALKSDIPDVPIKTVKKDGTALTPDSNGAVNVNVKGTKVDNATHADTAGSATSATSAGSATTAGTADVAKGYTSDGAIATALAEKADTAVATTTADGLMSSTDKTKLDGIDSNAKNIAFTRSLTSGTKIGTITISGTATDIYCEKNTNTDTKVTQNATQTSVTGNYPILVKNSTGTTTTTDTSRFIAEITITPSTGAITATKFVGDLDGNATTATTATDYSETGGIATALDGKQPTGNYALRSEIPTDYVPNTRKVNNKALSADISLTASDVGAVPTTRTVNGKALSSNITLTASNVGALSSTTTVTNVSFASDTTANVYPILMKGSTGATTTASGTKFNTGITITPSTGTVTATAFKGNLDGIATSATTASDYATTGTIKEALDSKQATITGGASSIASSNLTASRALISNASGKVAISAVTSTELGYLDGVTSSVQAQLNGKQDKILSASNISVLAGGWATGHADGDFIYRASITLSGCTASMIPAVVFSTTDAISGDYSPVCESGADVIYIWSKKNVAINVLTALAIPQ